MVDKKIIESMTSDLYKFVDINMKRFGDVDDSRLAIAMMADGFKDSLDDEYLRGIAVGLMLANVIIEYCERKVN